MVVGCRETGCTTYLVFGFVSVGSPGASVIPPFVIKVGLRGM